MNRRQRTLLSLSGLSVGDALGERFFGPSAEAIERINRRELPKGPWGWTDDTQMALSIVDVLHRHQAIDPDALAEQFAMRYQPDRGYGGGAHRLLQSYRAGASWRQGAQAMFNGQGSYGNGGAMRAAPIGAHFADDLERALENARLSARVTHAHPEAIAGTVAIAIAAAVAWRHQDTPVTANELLGIVLDMMPEGETHQRITAVRDIASTTHPYQVASEVGSGQNVAAHDTVPFALWCAAHNLDDYEEAFWTTVAGLGDRDTTCAMVGGVVALSSRKVPAEWISAREPLPSEFSD